MAEPYPLNQNYDMRILILGGTAWLGACLVETALAAGHHVACLARGTSGSAPPGAQWVQGDRSQPGAYDAVVHQRWDSVIDVSRQPGQVRGASAALSKACTTFIFVSSLSVYADHQALDQDEHAALLPPLRSDAMDSMDQYGQAKVACEQAVLGTVGADRSLILRAGLIGGPGDASDRSGYWPLRFARAAGADRRVLVPDVPSLATQVIDVRDLAAWIIDCTCRGVAGIFNATGETTTFGDHLETARAAAGHGGPVAAAGSDWLLSQGVAPWAGPKSLPLWLPMADHAGFSARNSSAAVAAGLSRRALAATLADTLEWERHRHPAPLARRAGLSDADEAVLLGRLDAQRHP